MIPVLMYPQEKSVNCENWRTNTCKRFCSGSTRVNLGDDRLTLHTLFSRTVSRMLPPLYSSWTSAESEEDMTRLTEMSDRAYRETSHEDCQWVIDFSLRRNYSLRIHWFPSNRNAQSLAAHSVHFEENKAWY